MQTVKLDLYKGDARDIRNFMMIMGFNNPLKHELEQESKNQFKQFSLPQSRRGNVTGDIIQLDSGVSAASLKTRFRHNTSERPSTDLTVLIAYAYLFLSCPSFTILPLSWRHPNRVAASTLLSIWNLAYHCKLILRKDNFNLRFAIASIDSIEPYEVLLQNNGDKLWEYIETIYGQCEILEWFRVPLKREEVNFDVTTL